MRRRTGQVLGACMVAALLTGGCGSGGGSSTARSGAATSGPLMQALAAVRASPISRTSFAWSDMAAVRRYAGYPSQASKLGQARSNPKWSAVFGIGTNGLAALEPPITAKTGIDFFAADRAVQIGIPPNVGLRIDGPRLDTSAITRSLRADGAKPQSVGGRTLLAIGAEHSVNLNGPLGTLGVVNQLDRSVAQNHAFVAGSAVAPVVALLGGRPSLADDPAYQAAAGCLGDVVTTEIAPPAGIAASGSAASLIAIGDRRPGSAAAPVTEVLCAIDTDSSAAQRQGAHIRAILGPSGQLPHLSEHSGAVVSSVHVSQTKKGQFTVLQALIGLRPRQQAGFLNHVYLDGAIGELLGG